MELAGSDGGGGAVFGGGLGTEGAFSELFAGALFTGGAGAGAGGGTDTGGLAADSSEVLVFDEGPCTKALNESRADSNVRALGAFCGGEAEGEIAPLEAEADEDEDEEEDDEDAGVDASSILKRPLGITTSSSVLRLRKRPDT